MRDGTILIVKNIFDTRRLSSGEMGRGGERDGRDATRLRSTTRYIKYELEPPRLLKPLVSRVRQVLQALHLDVHARSARANLARAGASSCLLHTHANT